MKALVLLAMVAGCSEEKPAVSQGTGGAVCSFSATGTMSNLSTTSLASNDITDTITGTVAPGPIIVVRWLASFAADGGCVGAHELGLVVTGDPAGGDSFTCSAGAGVSWAESECNGTRKWQCTGGMVHVDAVSDTSIDLSFANVSLANFDSPGGSNTATGTVSMTGSCTGVHLTR